MCWWVHERASIFHFVYHSMTEKFNHFAIKAWIYSETRFYASQFYNYEHRVSIDIQIIVWNRSAWVVNRRFQINSFFKIQHKILLQIVAKTMSSNDSNRATVPRWVKTAHASVSIHCIVLIGKLSQHVKFVHYFSFISIGMKMANIWTFQNHAFKVNNVYTNFRKVMIVKCKLRCLDA